MGIRGALPTRLNDDTESVEETELVLVHIVFFTLKDTSETACQTLVKSGKQYLSGHPGEVFFAIGTLNPELNRPVNDRDFQVALHVVFATKADHDAYQLDPRHLKFIEENKPNWEKVRVFDSDCS